MADSTLQVYNSLSGKKEKFEPINPPFVGLYVCGPTVYNEVHLGNARTFTSFDMINRYMRFLGYDVRYVRNITDAGHLTDDGDEGEDKIGKMAKQQRIEPMQIVQKYTLNFHEVMDRFNALPPDIEPTATGHIIEQINMAQQILDKGLAYEKNGSIYFDVAKFDKEYSYGDLSGRKIEDMISGTRTLDGQDEKENPIDFALWKKADPSHIMRWDSPWGEGFPGWHLECSVMSSKYLGDQFDIHGGGMDLKFPHHECEIAQGTAANGQPPVKYWLHGNMLTFEGTKMSKSAGNGILPNELFTGNHHLLDRAYSPMVVRFFMMQAHYRSTLDFSNEALSAAEKGFGRLMSGLSGLSDINAGSDSDNQLAKIEEIRTKCQAAMNDDFNTPITISHLYEALKIINLAADGKSILSQKSIDALKQLFEDYLFTVMGLKQEESSSKESGALEGAMELILEMRQRAREQKDWGTSDKIRDTLKAHNIAVKDGKEGAKWEFE